MKSHATKLPEPLGKRLEEYTDEQGVSKSEAMRELIRAGLHRHENPHSFSLAVFLAWLGSLGIAASSIEVGSTVTTASYVLFGIGVLLHSSAAVGWLRSLRASVGRELAALREQAGFSKNE